MTDVLRRSVTRVDDTPGPVWNLVINLPHGDGVLPDVLPSSWRRADAILRRTPQVEGMWASAVRIAIDSVAMLEWEIAPGPPRLVLRANDILRRLPFRPTLMRVMQDYLLTNNGAFIEVIRASSARGARVLALAHLDSRRCVRTGDRARPVVYTDARGVEHELRDYQVISFADMESPEVDEHGLGWCAAARAYHYVRKLAAIEQYLIDKIGGKRPQSIEIITGLSDRTMEGAIEQMEAEHAMHEMQRNRSIVYRGALMVMATSPNIGRVSIPLAELPDGFNRMEEWRIALLAYAKALGIDPQDLQPLSAGPLGTATQSEVLADKGKRQGTGLFRAQLIDMLHMHALPHGTTFAFLDNDYADRREKAALAKLHTDDLVQQAWLTDDQKRQMKVDYGEIPDAFLGSPDTTDEVSVSSDENIDSAEEVVDD